MKYQGLLATLILLFSSPSSWAIQMDELRSGDIVLLSLDCYECRMIEQSGGSRFSHSGVIIKDLKGRLFVAEALGDVHHVPLQSFLNRSSKGRPPQVLRLKEIAQQMTTPQDWNHFETQIRQTYLGQFFGAPFDPHYRWDNYDNKGQELLYCSEFVVKLLNHWLSKPLEPKPMSFKANWKYWQDHFPQGVPEGLPGASPGDLYHSPLVKNLGTLPSAN
jgi:hypothetical protein